MIAMLSFHEIFLTVFAAFNFSTKSSTDCSTFNSSTRERLQPSPASSSAVPRDPHTLRSMVALNDFSFTGDLRNLLITSRSILRLLLDILS